MQLCPVHCDTPILLVTEAERQTFFERHRSQNEKLDAVLMMIGAAKTSLGGSENASARMELERQKGVEEKLLRELKFVIDHLQVVGPVASADTAEIGTVITIRRYEYDTGELYARGNEQYHIGGYSSTDLRSSPPTMSYDSPLIRTLIGKPVDSMREPEEVLLTNGRRYFVELMEISLPRPAFSLVKAA